MASIKYPIGIQTFSEIRKEGYIYVDKTEYIWNLANCYKYVFMSRPRRFGKSLFVSTLDAYFRGQRELFQGLAIEKFENDWTEYPVIHLDFSAEDYSMDVNLDKRLNLLITEMESVYGKPAQAEDTISSRFRGVIRRATDKTGQKVVVLIDEYDKPLLGSLHEQDRHERMRSKLQGFYSVLKECDPYIRFVLITGVTKFAHVSIFSGLNNMKDISLLPKFNAICGITEKELSDNFQSSLATFAEDNGITLEKTRSIIKANYDGYHFSIKLQEDVYNPFSMISAFDESNVSDYWFSTGTPSYIPTLLRKNAYPLEDLEGTRRTKSQLTDMADPDLDIVPMLFQSGYLTIKGWIPTTQQYVLGFPNEEVRKGFWDSLSRYYIVRKSGNSIFDINLFIDEVEKGDAQGFMVRLKSLFASIESDHEPNKEVHFRNMMVIVAKMCGFRTHSEIHTSQGRCDMIIETNNYLYIFEFKINSTSGEALKQIKERGYAVSHEAGKRNVLLIGANFSTKTRTLTDWIIQTG